MAFADNLRQLPSIAHVKALELRNRAGALIGTIENKPGSSGSVAVFAALAAGPEGIIDPAAAERGLAIYAEHTEDARAHPGKHPNIDRLFQVMESGEPLYVTALTA